jgi:AcrR family transcriptional regulator
VRSAAAAIDEIGEPAVRLGDLAQSIGVVQVTLLRWFGSLHNLLNAAHLHRFESAQVVLAPWLPAAFEDAKDVADLQRALDIALDDALSSEGEAHRAVLANLLAISMHRPSLAERLWPRLSGLRSDLSVALGGAQTRGLIPATVEVEPAAVMLRAHLFGLLVLDLHPPLTPEAALKIAEELRHGVHLTVLAQPAPARVAPTVAIGHVSQPLRSAEVDLDAVGERMLAETVRLLGEGGESSTRVVDIVDAVGVNVSQLHRRFGDLQGLIVLAQAQRLAGSLKHDVGLLEEVSTGEDLAALRVAMGELAHAAIGGNRRTLRLARLSALGASFLRPPLQAVAAAVHAEHYHRHSVMLQRVAERYCLSAPPVRLSIWSTVTIFGLVLADVEFEPPDIASLVRITHDMWLRMLRVSSGASAPPVTVWFPYAAITLEPVPEDPAPLVSTPPRNATSEAIVAAAEQLLCSDGPAGATPARIAEAADVNDATINYYFRSREHLYLAVVQRAAKARQVRLRHALGILARGDDTAWVAGILGWFERETAAGVAGPLWRQLRALAACDPQLARAVGDADAALLALLATEFGVGADDGRWPPFAAAWEALQLLMIGAQGLAPSTPSDRVKDLVERLQVPVVAALQRSVAHLRVIP